MRYEWGKRWEIEREELVRDEDKREKNQEGESHGSRGDITCSGGEISLISLRGVSCHTDTGV